MDSVISVHRDAELHLGHDFSTALEDLGAAALQGAPEVKVSRGGSQSYDRTLRRFVPDAPWTDVSSQFIEGDPAIDGAQVLWLKKRRSGSEQAAGSYVVWCRVQTDTGFYLVDTFELEVSDEGSVS